MSLGNDEYDLLGPCAGSPIREYRRSGVKDRAHYESGYTGQHNYIQFFIMRALSLCLFKKNNNSIMT